VSEAVLRPGPAAQAEPPAWTTAGEGAGRLLPRVGSRVARAFERWVLCRGDKVAYLRRLGARIGPHAAVVCRVEDFGSEPWLVEIGSRVSIAAGVVFVTHDGASRVFRERIEGGSRFGNAFAPIRVRDNCMIGLRAILLPGVTVGPDSIVGAASLVTRDVPPGTVVAGVPARVVCTLEQYVERYRERMIPGLSSDRAELRRQLTRRFWGEER
jgi:acetyltransferase-like isoleucine patch superfamily enzyme